MHKIFESLNDSQFNPVSPAMRDKLLDSGSQGIVPRPEYSGRNLGLPSMREPGVHTCDLEGKMYPDGGSPEIVVGPADDLVHREKKVYIKLLVSKTQSQPLYGFCHQSGF
jgi:hypothetical protein